MAISFPRTTFRQFLHASQHLPPARDQTGAVGTQAAPEHIGNQDPGWRLKRTPLENHLAASALVGPGSGRGSLSSLGAS